MVTVYYLSGHVRYNATRLSKFPLAPHISLVVTSLCFTLISNYYECWMFLLVSSSAHAVGCKEIKYGAEA